VNAPSGALHVGELVAGGEGCGHAAWVG